MGSYTISNFVEIHNQGFDYRLPLNALNIIRELHKKLKSNPEQVKHISFKKHLQFKQTPIITAEEKEKNILLSARLILNKVTNKTYFECLEKIQQLIQKLSDEVELQGIAELIFEISATNRFYSKLYADLYSSFISSHPIFFQYYTHRYESYFETFENIEYVDSNIDYDRFCTINSINEKRKALSLFFLNLMLNAVVPKSHVENILQRLVIMIESFISTPNKINEVDEMVENLACLYNKQTHATQFGDSLSQLSKLKRKDCESLSSKSLFKLKDLVK
jgi:hypothetical protein